MTYGEKGTHLRLQVGDEIEVTLPETATTGYRWTPSIDESLLRQVSDSSQAPLEPRGAPGKRTFVFRAVGTGAGNVRLIKKRSWEATAQDEFAVEFNIAPLGH